MPLENLPENSYELSESDRAAFDAEIAAWENTLNEEEKRDADEVRKILTNALEQKSNEIGFRYLKISSLPNVFNKLPWLKKLDLIGCKNLKTLPDLSGTKIKELYLVGCESLTEIKTEHLPEGLTILNLVSCIKLETLPDLSGTQITELYLSGCEGLAEITTEHLPKGLTTLNLVDCIKLETLPDLSNTQITNLILAGCEGLTEIKTEHLPEGLKILNLFGCKNLKTLPNLSKTKITYLNLFGCKNLEDTPELRLMLEALEDGGCIVIRPDHIVRDGPAKAVYKKLDEIVEKYQEQKLSVQTHSDLDPSASIPADQAPSAQTPLAQNHSGQDELGKNNQKLFPKFEEMIKRLTNESLGQRGGVKQIIGQIMPVLALLEKDPKQLEMADLVASHYLENCVNQPQRGFLIIASILKAIDGKEGKIGKKLEALKYFKVLDFVECLVQSSSKAVKVVNGELVNFNSTEGQVGELVEAEAANAATITVANRLIENGLLGKDDAIALPAGIAHALSVESWLNEELPKEEIGKEGDQKRIDYFYEKTKENLSDYQALVDNAKKEIQQSGQNPEAFARITDSICSGDSLYKQALAMALFPTSSYQKKAELENAKNTLFSEDLYSENEVEKKAAESAKAATLKNYNHLLQKHQKGIDEKSNTTAEAQLFVALGLELGEITNTNWHNFLKESLTNALKKEAQEAAKVQEEGLVRRFDLIKIEEKTKAVQKEAETKAVLGKNNKNKEGFVANFRKPIEESRLKNSPQNNPRNDRDSFDYKFTEPSTNPLARTSKTYLTPSGGNLREAPLQHKDAQPKDEENKAKKPSASVKIGKGKNFNFSKPTESSKQKNR